MSGSENPPRARIQRLDVTFNSQQCCLHTHTPWVSLGGPGQHHSLFDSYNSRLKPRGQWAQRQGGQDLGGSLQGRTEGQYGTTLDVEFTR